MVLKNKGIVGKLKNRFFNKQSKKADQSEIPNSSKIKRAKHGVSRNQISKNALKVMYRLKEAGYDAYLVGGSVRDLLCKRKPKDFDVVTNGTPEQVRKIFRNSRIIGRRFRLVHVYYKDEIIELSTFRANLVEKKSNQKMIRSDNIYGTIEEDAWRRDFTVNALYYNINDFSMIDFMGGVEDLRASRIRMIGDPEKRFREDPVRLLRAIRLSAKLNFSIEPDTEKALLRLGHLLKEVPQARLLDEIVKLFFEGNASVTFQLLQEKDYFSKLFPTIALLMQQDKKASDLIHLAMASTDQRFSAQQFLTPGFLLAVFLWPVLQQQLKKRMEKGERFFAALHNAMQETLDEQSQVCLITRRMKAMMQAMWLLQYYLEKRRPQRVYHLLKHRYFRAAYDLLVLRAEASEVSQELSTWWETFQAAKPEKRQALVEDMKKRG